MVKEINKILNELGDPSENQSLINMFGNQPVSFDDAVDEMASKKEEA